MIASQQIVQDQLAETIADEVRDRQAAIETLQKQNSARYSGRGGIFSVIMLGLLGANAHASLQTNWGQIILCGLIFAALALAIEAYREARLARKKLDAALVLIANGDLATLKKNLR